MDKAGEVLEGHLEQRKQSSELAVLTAATKQVRGARPGACGCATGGQRGKGQCPEVRWIRV